mmetsp:Transcript_25348/g.53011  ORF Transcript_25348/g.53011 Transcript_25348/m.53011 type:complete len:208 (+) Transcript_25348:390-1013(+)
MYRSHHSWQIVCLGVSWKMQKRWAVATALLAEKSFACTLGDLAAVVEATHVHASMAAVARRHRKNLSMFVDAVRAGVAYVLRRREVLLLRHARRAAETLRPRDARLGLAQRALGRRDGAQPAASIHKVVPAHLSRLTPAWEERIAHMTAKPDIEWPQGEGRALAVVTPYEVMRLRRKHARNVLRRLLYKDIVHIGVKHKGIAIKMAE